MHRYFVYQDKLYICFSTDNAIFINKKLVGKVGHSIILLATTIRSRRACISYDVFSSIFSALYFSRL